MANWDIESRPNIFPWPPVLLVIFIAAGLGLDRIMPLPLAIGLPGAAVGVLLIIGAVALDIWASLTFRRARTTLLPHCGTNALVTGGPFRFSRNPIYVGNMMILVGVGLVTVSAWPIMLAPLLALAIQKLAIEREEAHLHARFGTAWQRYADEVRRWV